MRIRQIKPSFWQDSRIAALPPAARLFYIGLWMIADDAGYFRWDATEVANELYGYEGRKRRERDVEAFLGRLIEATRVEMFPCGHGRVPTFTKHQRLAGETHQVRTFQKEHLGCTHGPADPRESPLIPARNGKVEVEVRNVKVRNGQSSRARAQGGAAREPSEFERAIEDAGGVAFRRPVQ